MYTVLVAFLFIPFLMNGAVQGTLLENYSEEERPAVFTPVSQEEHQSLSPTVYTPRPECEQPPSSDIDLIQPPIEEKRYSLGIFFKAKWFRAAQYCRYNGMRLATITSEEDEQAFENILESVGFELGPIWTSGTDAVTEGEFFWMSSGTPVTYTKWLDGEPNSENEDCLAVGIGSQGYGWNDVSCDKEYYFVCEFFTHNYTRPAPATDHHYI